MEDLRKNESLDKLIQNPICILQFGDETCGPCYALRNRLEKWLSEQPRISARYIPIREYPAISAQMGVFTVPAIIVYTDGKPAIRESGYFSLENILRRIERYLRMLEEQTNL